MSDDLVKVTVSDGKYTFIQRADGSCVALRYGEPWRENIFDGLMLGMAHSIESLTEANEVLTAEVARLGTQCEGLAQSAINNGQALIIAEAKLNKTVSALREIAAQTKDVTPELLNLDIAIHSVHRCANDILKEHL
jgi:hypothetical protein